MIVRRGSERLIERRQREREREREIKMSPLPHLRKSSMVKLHYLLPYLNMMYADSGPWLETMPLPMKGCKIQAYSLCRVGSLWHHTCHDTGPRFALSQPKDLLPRLVAIYDEPGLLRTFSNPDLHGRQTNIGIKRERGIEIW